jgi:predicted GH43/DUF377 family glycosyl hydrolase
MKITIIFIMVLLVLACTKPSTESKDILAASPLFPSEIVDFVSHKDNPVFKGTGSNTWDENIRERGYILREEDGYHLWYTGYREGKDAEMHLGYATSPDGISWTRYKDNPIFDESWVEDVMVIKSGSLYYMFAEGRNDVAHMLTSADKIHWKDHGSLQIRYTNGQPLSEGPYGTPTVWIENGTWHLFYERNDCAIWLATSKNLQIWTNVRDEPVLKKGPESYDRFGVAVNQVIKHQGSYYAYYHGTAFRDGRVWSTNVAVSKDLVTWEKYGSNPIMKGNKSSGILVHDGSQYRLYTMHPLADVHFSSGGKGKQIGN